MGIVSWLWQWTPWSAAHTAGDTEFNAVDCCFLCFSELHNYCCVSYSKLRDISAPLLTKIIASFASHMNMRKCTLFALSFSPCMTHKSTLVPTGWLVCMSIFLYTCRRMSYVCSCWLECVSQAHLYLYTMLCQSCMLISCGVMARLAMCNIIII